MATQSKKHCLEIDEMTDSKNSNQDLEMTSSSYTTHHLKTFSIFSASDVIPHDRTRIPMLAQRAFPLQPRAFPLQPRAFPLQPRAFPPQPRNQASKCQHSSSLISSIKKRNFRFLKEFYCHSRDLNGTSRTI